MPIENFKSGGVRPLLWPLQIKGGAGDDTLTGDVVLTAKASQWLRLDPGGASRNVDLPGMAEGLDDSDGAWFLILNTADAAEDLTIRDPAGATVATVGQNERALFVGTGAEAWIHMGIETIALT
ncbi:MAG: hypothetical protein KAI41_11375 [Hyphomicrobiaceae bacterium]|nr:hypothetical protein [Hyphomicrobiaceae bacterium]MCK5495168.1 hypothetical protein [Hyphomicrobiaceae bacterium]MCK5551123.1 hypothetical protein [Hyphomicrobiaceae bacterium]